MSMGHLSSRANLEDTPREQPLGNICDCKVVGDEYHYLVMCS